MAVQTSTTPVTRHILGDLAVRFYTLAVVATGDTLVVSGPQVLWVDISPNTTAGAANTPVATWVGNTVTFASGGAWGGTVLVLSRTG